MEDRFASECMISSSQEEILRRIEGWEPADYPQRCSSTQRPDNPSEDEDEDEDEDEEEELPHPNALSPALGAKRTIICSALDSEDCPEEEIDVRNAGEDSFDCKFESDRDQSPLTQSQSIRIGPNDLYNSQAITPQQKPPRQNGVFSGSVKRISASTRRNPHHNQVTPKPPSCRQLVMGPSNDGQCKSSAIPPAKSSSILAADEPAPATQAFSQEGLLSDIGGIDVQPTAAESPNLHVGDTDRAEGQVGFKDGAEGRVSQRKLPPSFKAASQQIETSSTSTDSFEEDPAQQKEYGPKRHSFEEDPGQQKGYDPKRQRMNPKPFPETLMDVIMHYSGGPPSRSEDVDIVEVAINAGMTFPPPLSRRPFHA